MPGTAITPADPISGLPLLISPEASVLPILHGELPDRDLQGHVIADWNHAFHPSGEVLRGGDGAGAVRNARTQFVMRATHDDYHDAYYGPDLPRTPAERFRTAVLCAAGYIPPQALQFGSGGVRTVALSMEQRERLRTSGEVRMASSSVVHTFIHSYVMSQPFDHIRRSTINRFLHLDPRESPDAARQYRQLACQLLDLVIDRVEDIYAAPYAFGYGRALLDPGVPRRPGHFVRSVLIPGSNQRRRVATELSRKFRLGRDEPGAYRPLGGLVLAS